MKHEPKYTRRRATVLAGILTLSMGAASFTTEAAPAPVPVVAAAPDASLGAVQAKLASWGYSTKATGVMDAISARAISHSQKASGLTVTGTVTPELLAALRIGTPPTPITPPATPNPTPATPSGLWGKPFAPAGLSDCAEMTFYRVQWGLPAQFDKIGWRESNCRNEDGVKTFCCYGYWQLYVSLFLKDHRMKSKMAACGVSSYVDINSDTPLDKQRQACVAAALYGVVGMTAWVT